MLEMRFDVKATRELEQAELEAGRKLAEAQADDDARQAAIAAGTRRPPGPGERPFMKAARDRGPVHTANANELHLKIDDITVRYDQADAAAEALAEYDAETADPLHTMFFNQWLAIPEKERAGRKLFYPTLSKSDYGNPSYDDNRSWWDAAATTFKKPDLTLPAAIAAFKDQVLDVASQYGKKLDAAKSAKTNYLNGWSELMTLCAAYRKDRRITRGYLKEDFDRNMAWVDELVPPAPAKGKPAPQTPPPGGNQ